jgi:hypothetical protein
MIDSLLYLTVSKSDIMFIVCSCARYQTNPKESYLLFIKRILKYIKGTQNHGLWYGWQSTFDLIGFTYATLWRSIGREEYKLDISVFEGLLVSLSSHKQTMVALSTTEA